MSDPAEALAAIVTASPWRLCMAARHNAQMRAEEEREAQRQERLRIEHPALWRAPQAARAGAVVAFSPGPCPQGAAS